MTWRDNIPQAGFPADFNDAVVGGSGPHTWMNTFLEWLAERYGIEVTQFGDGEPNTTWEWYALMPLITEGALCINDDRECREKVDELYRTFHEEAKYHIGALPIPKTIDFAFLCGHGGFDETASQVTIPTGMTIRYACLQEEALLSRNSLRSLTEGRTTQTFESYTEGASIPNYILQPYVGKYGKEGKILANMSNEVLFIVGEEPLQSGATQMCTTPGECGMIRHTCDGILARLGHVSELVALHCRPSLQDIRSGTARTTTQHPSDKTSQKNSIRGPQKRVIRSQNPSMIASLMETSSHEDALKMMTSHSVGRHVLATQMLKFRKENGILAYYAHYRNHSATEQAWLDDVAELRDARIKAQSFVERFADASDTDRLTMADQLDQGAIHSLRSILPWLDLWLQNPHVPPYFLKKIEPLNKRACKSLLATSGRFTRCLHGSGMLLIMTHQDSNFHGLTSYVRGREHEEVLLRLRIDKYGRKLLAELRNSSPQQIESLRQITLETLTSSFGNQIEYRVHIDG